MLANIDNLDCISILKPEIFAMILDADSEAEKVELEEKCLAKLLNLE